MLQKPCAPLEDPPEEELDELEDDPLEEELDEPEEELLDDELDELLEEDVVVEVPLRIHVLAKSVSLTLAIFS